MADEMYIQELIERLGRKGDIRWTAMEKLAEIGEPAVPALINALKDEDYNVKEDAADVLEKIGEPAVPYIIDALKDKHSKVRIYPAHVLGIIGDERAVLPLSDALKDNDVYVREKAARALGEIAEKGVDVSSAVPALIDALKDKHRGVRTNATWALGKIAAAKTAIPLIESLKDEEVCFGDVCMRDKAAEALEEILNKPIKEEEYSAALTIIKALTLYIRKKYEGKKDGESLKKRRKELGKLESLTQQIHDKMNPDKKKFPVKHQPVKTARKKVITNG